ncbi:MAG: DUF4249 family protein [Bacteroidetes bacterium]|nr:MAG: DUF4249 family protein [Bacteroidota bacterium]
MRISLFLILTALTGLLACEQIVEEPLPPHTPRLVVFAFWEAGQPLDAYVSRSYGALEDLTAEEVLIRDATVSLEIDGQPIPLTYRDTTYEPWPGFGQTFYTGKYEAERDAEADKIYTLRVSHPDYESVQATAVVPRPPVVRRAWIERDVFRTVDPLGNDQGSQSLLHVEVEDPAGVGDYYEVRDVDLWYEYPGFRPGLQRETLYVPGEAVIASEGGYAPGSRAIPDTDFDGQSGTLTFLISLPSAYDEPAMQDSLVIQSLVMTVRTFGATYAGYLEKLDLQRETQNGGLNFFPAEAVVVPSNVEDGYGIVAGISAHRDSFPQ